jgi:RNA polymerase sigma factor (sigma-70 family)
VVLTARKAIRVIKKETAAKRGGGKVSPASDLPSADEDGEEALAQALAREPSPELAAQMADEFRRLLDRLRDDESRAIALWQLEGYTVDEIAEKLGCSPRTVARKLVEIRDLWREERPM